jgi:hypothetical protein
MKTDEKKSNSSIENVGNNKLKKLTNEQIPDSTKRSDKL